jgi:NADPH-dependent 2,4-dienoyl-CoA reductase/sulfur reductase-like enzyme
MELAQYVGYCTINPLANLPFDPYELEEAKEKKRVLVVGGGVAGLQAAITAYDRGHEVILCEQSDKLGGVMYYADMDIDKPDLHAFKDTMIAEVSKRGIDIRLNTEVTPALLAEIAPEHLLLATGAQPMTAPIPGIENAVQSLEVYKQTYTPGKRVVIVGGGLIGTEEGLFLAKTGHEVTVVEMLPRVANEAYGMYREALASELEKEGLTLYENTKCLEIGADFVRVLLPTGEEKTLAADTVLHALGMKSVPTDELTAAAEAAGIPVTLLGDAVKAAKIDQATSTAYLAAIEIGK